MWSWYDGKIVDVQSCAPGVNRFWVQVHSETPFQFQAGQFVTMDLPISEKRLQRWRSYSIANAPDGSGLLEFIISRSESGLGTKYLFEEAQVGTSLRFKGPDGAFTLPPVIDKDLVFICTGTGIAPFRSMLHNIRQQQKQHKNLHLIFGARHATHILYRDEMEELAHDMPGFRYDIALSRESQPYAHHGYVHPIYQSAYPTARPDVRFYLCGWSNMIDEAVAHLMMDCGYSREQIVYELYG